MPGGSSVGSRGSLTEREAQFKGHLKGNMQGFAPDFGPRLSLFIILATGFLVLRRLCAVLVSGDILFFKGHMKETSCVTKIRGSFYMPLAFLHFSESPSQIWICVQLNLPMAVSDQGPCSYCLVLSYEIGEW